MSAVLAALYSNHAAAEAVRTRLVEDGFPTDRVELASKQELGHAKLVPAGTTEEKLKLHFGKLFPAQEYAGTTQMLCESVLDGQAVIAVHPRGDIETKRAVEILERGGALDLRARDLDKQPMERAASPSEETIIPGVRKILLGPGKA